MYSSYTAASFARKHDLADRHGVNLEGALTWAFEFEDQPYFAGFRVLATNGIDLPVLNVFRMFGKMSGRRLAVGERRRGAARRDPARTACAAAPDVAALASLDGDKLLRPGVALPRRRRARPGRRRRARGQPACRCGRARRSCTQYRIDDEHSNAFTAWKRMGSPPQPTPEQYAELERAGQLAAPGPAETVRVAGGKATVRLTLPRQAVSLLHVRPRTAGEVTTPSARDEPHGRFQRPAAGTTAATPTTPRRSAQKKTPRTPGGDRPAAGCSRTPASALPQARQ